MSAARLVREPPDGAGVKQAGAHWSRHLSNTAMASLTRKQRQVLDFVRSFTEENGYSPSLEEIAAGLGFASVSNAHQHVTALVERGHLRRPRGKNRGLEVVRGEHREIPMLGAVAAGAPIEAVQAPETFTGAADLLERGDFVVRWRGEPLASEQIAEGDYLVVRAEATPEVGALVLALLDGQAHLLRLARSADGGLLLAGGVLGEVPLDSEGVAVRGVVEGVVRVL